MSKIKNIILGIIIAFVFLFFCVYGTKLVYKAPEYSQFCNDTKILPPAIPMEKTGYNYTYQQEQTDYYQQCQGKFDKSQEDYSKNLFIISLVFSLIIIAVSAFLIPVESVSGGLMLGSLMFLIYGIGSYWRFMNDYFRFVILGIALLILIYIGYKLARKKKKSRR